MSLAAAQHLVDDAINDDRRDKQEEAFIAASSG